LSSDDSLELGEEVVVAAATMLVSFRQGQYHVAEPKQKKTAPAATVAASLDWFVLVAIILFWWWL
jgi:hypothetical protein